MGLFDAPAGAAKVAAPQANGTEAAVVPMPTVFAASPKNSLVQIGVRHGGRRVKANKSGGGGPITILLQGSKDAGKTTLIAGLAPMRPPGTRFVIISFDETSLKSLRNYYGNEWVEQNVEVYELVRRVVEGAKDAEGNLLLEGNPADPAQMRPVQKVVYPGFDPNDPSTAEDVVGELSLLLDELEKSGNVWGLVIDHFQFFWEGVLRSYSAFKAGLPSIAQMSIEHWGPRTDIGLKTEAKVRRIVPFDGGIVAITGYAPEVKVVMKQVPNGKGGTKTEVVREIKSPPWLRDDIIRNWDVMADAKVIASGNGSTSTASVAKTKHDYMVEILTSKVRRFPKGSQVNVTGSSLAKFWDPETVEKLRDLADGMEAEQPQMVKA